MDKNAIWKWLILIVLLTLSSIAVWPPKERIRLGLDLKGGISFTVKVDRERIREEIRSRSSSLSDEEVEAEVKHALRGAQDRALEVLRNRIDTLGISEPSIFSGKDNRITIQLPGINEAKREEAERSIRSVAFLEFRLVHKNNEDLVSELFAKSLAPEGYRIVNIADRLFYKRDRSVVPDRDVDWEYRQKLGRFHVPDAGYEFMLEKEEVEKQIVFRPAFVKRRREMSGEFVRDAQVDIQPLKVAVNLKFDSKGKRQFGKITSDYAPGGARNPNPNQGRQLAIVLDSTLYSAPYIKTAIYDGNAEISGRFSISEANVLARILRAGSLPAPLKVVETRFVAPSLGADSIRSSVHAVIYGGIGILVFMVAYYRLCGIIADLALVLNMMLLPLGMMVAAGFLGIFARNAGADSAMQLPVLTLPGIAGILLTIGMAVDANVLIFERVREESAIGRRLWTTITAGYERALVTITDANITTLLTGAILFLFGSGAIRGFAVTLCAGIMVSMFTSLVVTKLFFGIVASRMSVKALRMRSIIKDTHIDFIVKRKGAAILSIVVILVSWGLMVGRGIGSLGLVFGVDFTGGSSVTFAFEKKQPVEDIRSTLDMKGIKEAHIQYHKEMEKGKDRFLQIKVGSDPIAGKPPAEIVKISLMEKYPDSKFTVVQEDEVGALIGRELKKRAVLSIMLALLGIIIYLSWRFEFGFAVGAIVALIHDVLITVGIYSLFGRQLSLAIVAALLTIVGYSVNDTIVVFDRIREDLRLVRNKSFKDICNLSINQTLARTLLTSLTTLITVVMLLVFGGGAINDFALALCIGVLVGTYSSVFVATPVVLLWHRDKKPEFAAKGR